jgi:hypothetical protein
MTDKLDKMFELQRELQLNTYGKDPGTLTGEERIQFLKDMHVAQIDEMHESLGEIGWKPWATSKHVNEAAMQGELVDEFHFFMNRCMAVGMTPDMLYDKYVAKRNKNIARQEAGYDGVSEKCPGCRRALDDDAVACHFQGNVDGPGRVSAWCCHYESEGTIIYA